MFKAIILLVTLFLSFNVVAQEAKSKEEQEIYSITEEPAEFPGGTSELVKYIQLNMKRVPEAYHDLSFTSCKIFLKFIVDEEGNVTNVSVLKGCAPHQECDAEALRLVQSMPKWKPVKQDGKFVKSYYNLPISIKYSLPR